MRTAAVVVLLSVPAALFAQRTVVERPKLVFTEVAPPAGPPPSSVRATAGPTHIGLRWTCPSGATGYEVFATPAGGTQVKLTATPIPVPCIQDLEFALRNDPRLPGTTTEPVYISSYAHNGLTSARSTRT